MVQSGEIKGKLEVGIIRANIERFGILYILGEKL